MKSLFSVVALSGFAVVNAFGANVSGVVSFKGTAPKQDVIKMNADPYCAKAHSTPVTKQEVEAANGKLADVFVVVTEGIKAKPAPTTTPVVFDQSGCMYQPHVLGVEVNQPFKIVNDDQTLHNVHALPKVNSGFNMGMPTKGMSIEKKFTKAEMGVRIKCDVHGWMNAWVNIVDHPYYAVSDASGAFTIANLPAGDYTLTAWHEKLGTQTLKISVTDAGAKAPVEFTFGDHKS
jgi:hypothetical protein